MEKEITSFSDRLEEQVSQLFLSDLDLKIAQAEANLHNVPFGPILKSEFMTHFENIVPVIVCTAFLGHNLIGFS